ncbi:MAG TPA: Nramp family divalent metal transporter [Candidatus Hydrogenedentes bacterium]|nr:Nramp family divalent metal transporter [Candidatus Hydrogenedentota bacterium]
MESETKAEGRRNGIGAPPRGLALLMVLGPGLVWCGEYIGSGEVVLSTRTGAILGVAALWVPAIAIFAKLWIGIAGARYTVCTGECMVDMMGRTPGPRNWVIWPVLMGQICSGAIATGALASVAALFAAYFIPLPEFILGWAITLAVIALVWSGKFDPLKKVMSVLVALIIIGVFDVACTTWPGWSEVFFGLIGLEAPNLPAWAVEKYAIGPAPWGEILPLLGWAAGGFASQVWYTYWVFGAGYGMTKGKEYGRPLDPSELKQIDAETARNLRGWCRAVYLDATMAFLIGVTVTSAFMIAGAGVLGPVQIAPDGSNVALELSRIFSEKWGAIGAHLFILSGLAAMISTMLGQFAGWPRLLADCFRLLVPRVGRYPWKHQFRFILVCYALSNMVIVYTLGLKPVFLVKLGAVLDGLLLTPLQALAVGLVLYLVMPQFFSEDARRILKPHPIFAFGLLLAFVVFGYFCVARFPETLAAK